MLESRLESAAVKYAKKLGWQGFKLKKRSDPDRLFVHPTGKNLFVEFKKPGVLKAEDHQARRHKELRDQGFTVYLINNLVDFKTALVWELNS